MTEQRDRALSQQNARSATTIETRSFDCVPERERRGKVWHQGPFWFAGETATGNELRDPA